METDIDKIVADNVRLVYKQLHKFGRANDEDAFSIGLEALATAAATYNDEKNVKFSTYACVCVYNAIGTYIRRQTKKRQLSIVMYDDPVPGAGELTFYDILGAGASPEEEYLESELKAKLWAAFDVALNSMLSDVERDIILVWRESDFTKSQTAIAKETCTSQSHVSRTISAFKHKLKLELEEYLC